MQPFTPTPRATTSPPSSVGRIARLRLTEPLRLYLWPALAVLAAVQIAAAAVSGEWLGLLLVVPLLGMLLGAVEAARASVYSPRGVMRAAQQARPDCDRRRRDDTDPA